MTQRPNASVIACALLVIFAMGPPPAAAGVKVQIEEVFVDFNTETLMIIGQGLDCDSDSEPPPVVTLGGDATPLVIIDASTHLIEAELPTGLPAGD